MFCIAIPIRDLVHDMETLHSLSADIRKYEICAMPGKLYTVVYTTHRSFLYITHISEKISRCCLQLIKAIHVYSLHIVH